MCEEDGGMRAEGIEGKLGCVRTMTTNNEFIFRIYYLIGVTRIVHSWTR